MKAKAILPMQDYLDILKRQEIDKTNIDLIRQSFEECLVLFANNKKEINTSLKQELLKKGIILDIGFRSDKKQDIGIEDLKYTLNFI